MEEASIETAFITKLVQDRSFETLRQTRQEFLFDSTNKEVLAFVNDQVRRHSKIPSLAIVRAAIPEFHPEESEDSIGLLLDSVKDRKLYAVLQKQVKAIVQGSKLSPKEGMEALSLAATSVAVLFADVDIEDVTKSGAEVKKYYRELKRYKGKVGSPWPWQAMNDAMGGIRRKDFHFWYGPPATLKSWILLVIGEYARVQYGDKPLLYSFEVPIEDLRLRLAAYRAQVDYGRVTKGLLSKSEQKAFFAACDLDPDCDPFIVIEPKEFGRKGILDIRAKAVDMGATLVLIDGLMALTDSYEWNEVGMMTREVRQLPKSLGIPVVAVNHTVSEKDVNKNKDSMEMNDIAIAKGALARDCATICRIYRTEQHKDNDEIEVRFRKMREAKIQAPGFYIHAKPAVDFSQKGLVQSVSEEELEDDNPGTITKAKEGKK